MKCEALSSIKNQKSANSMASVFLTQTAIFVSIFLLVQSLYEDQAGTYDW